MHFPGCPRIWASCQIKTWDPCFSFVGVLENMANVLRPHNSDYSQKWEYALRASWEAGSGHFKFSLSTAPGS